MPVQPPFSGHAKSRIVRVLIGEHEQEYRFPESVLRESCGFFERMLQEDESQSSFDKSLALPEVGIVGFECFIEWLYTKDGFAEFEKAFLEAYATATDFGIDELKQHAVSGFTSWCHHPDTTEAEILEFTLDILDRNMNDSPFMYFIIHELAWRIHSKGYTNVVMDENWPRFIELGGTTAMIRLFQVLEKLGNMPKTKKQTEQPLSCRSWFWLEPGVDGEESMDRRQPAEWCINFYAEN